MTKALEERANALVDEFLDLQQRTISFLMCCDGEAKANFNPSQPRLPQGHRWGGRWTRFGGSAGDAPAPWPVPKPQPQPIDWSDLEVGFRDAARQVQQFLVRNQDAITRTVGGLQAVGGAGEVFGGAALVSGGVATSEVGVGIAIAGAGAWMVTNGYDNFLTGWRALLTGSPQQTNLNFTLRQFGLSSDEATAVEIVLAGSVTAGAARLSGEALEQAARAGLAQRALRPFAQEALTVRAGARRIWDEPDIELRGLAWEAFDAGRTGFQRTPRGFRTVDQFDRASGAVVSNKTLDLVTLPYSRVDRYAVLNRVSRYIDELAAFHGGSRGDFQILRGEILEWRLHLLLPAGESLPAQAVQIAAAERYALVRGVVLQVEYAH